MTNPYPLINGTKAGNNLMYLFLYANQVTNQFFVLFVVIAFFLVVLISSLIMQLRFAPRVRPEVSFLASSFASLGFVAILGQMNGLIAPIYYFVFVGLTVISFAWVALSSGE